MTVQTNQVRITPDLALKMLEKNTHNRALRSRLVEAFAHDISAGNWTLNGETIKVAADGTIIDGQHRLHAVILAGQHIDAFVVTGLELTTQDTVDTGARRAFRDVLKLRGFKDPDRIAAGIRMIYIWEQNRLTNNGILPTITQLSRFLDANPTILDDIARSRLLTQGGGNKVPASPSVLALAVHVLRQVDAEDATWFFDRLRDGANLESTHPVYALRRLLNSMRNSRRRVDSRMSLALIFKAWNAYRDGTPVTYLRFRTYGPGAEKFPTPK